MIPLTRRDTAMLLMGVLLTPLQDNNNKEEDEFATFAQEIQKGWPERPSPLPTSFKSAQELTTKTADIVENDEEESDLSKAIKESLRKKKIEPRSHG
eukprot:CAMPEP_0118695202 /NCGR_PEP_ID=MMETSP0800-20121206/13041_1 /TAXON_ID=210618 ORGANISM="Striatella unipunctata, Strain CCMP2910" /NCGR_SAMPLE_ID=MMETSP0800 /ASSEMBLY_ACC=CAM_ASM_000638 /LENGTH=96 /DNA_ID=CAMNT_0006593939 /DNA_START=207 /DNA_END=497 /DNA_ORIENTATION=-